MFFPFLWFQIETCRANAASIRGRPDCLSCGTDDNVVTRVALGISVLVLEGPDRTGPAYGPNTCEARGAAAKRSVVSLEGVGAAARSRACLTRRIFISGTNRAMIIFWSLVVLSCFTQDALSRRHAAEGSSTTVTATRAMFR